MSTTNEKALEGCAAFVMALPLTVALGAIRAYVAMKGWEWFVSDTFGIPELTFIQAWGLFSLISFAVLQLDKRDDNDYSPIESLVWNVVQSLMSSGLFLVILLILTLFL